MLGIDFAVAMTGMLLSLIAAGGSFLMSSILSRRRKQKAPTLEDTIRSLAKNIEAASVSISQIETEIAKRRDIAEKLRHDAEYFQQLKELNQAQVEAIVQTVRTEMSSVSKRSIWVNAVVAFAISAIFFTIGFFVGSW